MNVTSKTSPLFQPFGGFPLVIPSREESRENAKSVENFFSTDFSVF